MRALRLWPLAAMCFGAGWWCAARAHLFLEEQLLVAQATADARAAAAGEPS